MLIVCEGANTEKQYFEQFAEFHHNSLVDVIVEGGKGVPFSVVQAAKKLRDDAASEASRKADEYIGYQSVWCVFDFDEHPNPNGSPRKWRRITGWKSPCRTHASSYGSCSTWPIVRANCIGIQPRRISRNWCRATTRTSISRTIATGMREQLGMRQIPGKTRQEYERAGKKSHHRCP